MFELSSFWYLLIWLFTGGLILKSAVPRKTIYVCNQERHVWSIWGMWALIFPYIMWAAHRSDLIGDTGVYRDNYKNAAISWESVKNNFVNTENEKGFQLFKDVLHIIFKGNDVYYFFIIALIQLGIIFYIVRLYSEDLWLSLFVFIASTAYISGCFNGIRQFLASSICCLSIKYLLDKKYIKVIVLILIATTIHESAIIMLPIVFIAKGKAWNKRTLMFLGLAVLTILFTSQFTNLLGDVVEGTSYNGITTSQIWQMDDGVSPIRVLISFVPVGIALYGKRTIADSDNEIIDICVNISIINFGLYLVGMVTSGILIGRLPMYTNIFNLILYPWELKYIIKDEYKEIMKKGLIVCYIVVFYYEMFM